MPCFFITYGFIFTAELGDKTPQITTLLLSVKYQSFFSVLLGSLAALTAATLAGVVGAGRLRRFIPARYISPLPGILFALLGAGTLLFA